MSIFGGGGGGSSSGTTTTIAREARVEARKLALYDEAADLAKTKVPLPRFTSCTIKSTRTSWNYSSWSNWCWFRHCRCWYWLNSYGDVKPKHSKFFKSLSTSCYR